MKLAILIQCHKNPEQINRLLERLDHPSVDCFVHIDKKQKFADQIIKRKNVYVLPESERVSVEWAQISQVTATLNLLTAAYSTERRPPEEAKPFRRNLQPSFFHRSKHWLPTT